MIDKVNTTGLTGAALLEAAASRIHVRPDEVFKDRDIANTVAVWLDRAAIAFPIDHAEPPRNPKDRRVILAALVVASALVNRPQS